MFTLFALLARIISNPLANAVQKRASLIESSFTVNFYSSFFMLILALPLVLNIDFLSFNQEFYCLVLTSGFLCFLGTICLIKALSIGEMSVLGPINSYKSVIGLLFAFFLLGETPSYRSLLGFFIIIFASFFFLDENGKFILNKSVFLRLLALVFTGIEAVLLKKIIILSSPLTSLFFWVLSGFFFSFLSVIFSSKIKYREKRTLFDSFLIGFLLLIMQFSTNYVFKNLEVGLSLSLFQLSSVISLVIGFKIFKEKNILKKSIGTVLMLFGSILILL